MSETTFHNLQNRLLEISVDFEINPNSKKECSSRMTFAMAKSIVDSMTENSGAEGLTYKAAIILILGHRNSHYLRKITGWKYNEVTTIEKNLIKNGVWKKHNKITYHSGWFDEDSRLAWLSFWLDAMVGGGLLIRS